MGKEMVVRLPACFMTDVEEASRPVSCHGNDSKSKLFKTCGIPWCLMSSKKPVML